MLFRSVGIYWNNHHHMLHATEQVNGNILWANLHLLFWLSLIPFVTGWHGEYHQFALPAALYGSVLFMAGFAYWILQQAILSKHGRGSKLAEAVGKRIKEYTSLSIYLVAIASAFYQTWLADCLYVLVEIGRAHV